MKIIIHRGTHQIGGCVTEIQSNRGTRIAIDIGENLPSQDGKQAEELSIEGLTTEGNNNFDAVFITHYHGDHIGLYNKILPQIPVYIGKVSKEIFSILQEHLVKAKMLPEQNLALIDQFQTYQIPQKISVDDITITPIEVDHSAFNAHMFLIEADGKKVLHTGDFRIHGQRGNKVLEAIEKYVGQVDCLICEGTTLSREKKSCMTENELQRKAKEIFQDNQYTFVMCSSTNIDRIAAIHKATMQANKLFICDNYQKEVLMYIDSIARSELYKFKDKVLSYAENILELMKNRGFVMLVRDNYISKEVMKKFPQSTFVYSEWEGYLKPEFTEYKKMQEFVPKDAIHLHTSGHADYEAIKSVCKLVKPKVLIPIHGENPAEFKEMRIRKLRNKRDTRCRRSFHKLITLYDQHDCKNSLMFPKAHAVEYVINAFRIAWYKVHYPKAFYKAYFEIKSDLDIKLLNSKEKILQKLQELEETMKISGEYLRILGKVEDCKLALEMFDRNVRG